jgi:hypothetical protein
MWDPENLATLYAFTACYGDSFFNKIKWYGMIKHIYTVSVGWDAQLESNDNFSIYRWG